MISTALALGFVLSQPRVRFLAPLSEAIRPNLDALGSRTLRAQQSPSLARIRRSAPSGLAGGDT